MIRDKKNEITTIKELIVSFLTDTISEDDKISLENWIKQDPKNGLLFNEMLKTWQYSGTLNKSVEEDTIAEWDKLKAIIDPDGDRRNINPFRLFNSGRSARIKVILSWAASVILALFIGGAGFRFFSDKGDIPANPQLYQVITPNGTRSEILLADGTKVWLNAGSTLKYAEDFNKRNRKVELIGEAYFQVKTNKRKPFTVSSSGLTIQALGTSFNIKSYPEDKSFVATLVEGKITLEGKSREKGHFKYVLSPRQKIVCIKTSVKERIVEREKEEGENIAEVRHEVTTPQIGKVQIASNVKTELYTSWKDNRWLIEGESLPNLAIMLERRYNVKILYDPDVLNNFTFSGIIENESLDQVLNILTLSAPLKYEFGKGLVRLSIDKNQQRRFQRLINGKNHPNQ